MSLDHPSPKSYAMIIGGKPVLPAKTFEVTNPATGEVVGLAPQGTKADAEAAIAAARAAFPAWAATPDEERAALCHAIAEKLDAHADELARLITMEQGKPLGGVGSRFEVGGSSAWCHFTAEQKLAIEVIADDEKGRVELHRKPLGVVASVTPWNWPMLIATWHILPAIRTGNTVVSKPSPYTPLSTLRYVELMNEVLPAGVVNVICSDETEDNLGAELSAAKGVNKIVFTGSIPTGMKVAAAAAPTMKRMTLELGGNDAGIVMPDVDPKAIAEGLFWSAFINMGQTCAALKRLYVHEDVHDAVCEALADYVRNIPMGPGLEDSSIMGPVANQMQFDKVAALVADAATKGTVLTGGAPGEGLFFPLTLISGLDNGVPLVDEEQFGPALPIIKFKTVDEAIEKANAGDAALGGSVWSADIDAAKAIGDRLDCGTVWINQHGMTRPDTPFGGRKMSGVGVEFGQDGLNAYTDIQAVIV
ncbi:aldehyde dehydrogenase family protein [Celeribacter sp. SCSIO 80788]|uniref:aldehyde dehydrogenase family protein n=1 Tax=Celeribacter sp. SCSIO 80788 TaxID=3117013 RepID=UPI003DA2A8BC